MKKRADRIPVSLNWGARCPDCNTPCSDGRVTHAPGCPMLRALIADGVKDIAWFEKHPDERSRTRRLTRTEVGALAALKPDKNPAEHEVFILLAGPYRIRALCKKGVV